MSLLPSTSITRTQLYAQLSAPAVTVIAANRRLVRDCLWRYGLWQQSRGLSVWATPAVCTFDEYLHKLWQQQLLTEQAALWPQPARVLATLDRRRLWQNIIAQQEGDRALLRMAETARLAAEAYELEMEFDLPASVAGSEDVSRYRSWRQLFSDYCRKKNWLTPAQLQTQIISALANHQLVPAQQIILLGFDDVPPALQRFIQIVVAQNGQIATVAETETATQEYRFAFDSRENEMCSAVQWAQTQAANGQRIALVMPDLTARRHDIERILRRVIHPDAAQSFTALHKGRYNISAGASLYDQAMVQAALLALRLFSLAREWSLTDLSQFLHSPYVGDYARDAAIRARLDVRWRDLGNDTIRVSKALQQFENAGLTYLHQHCIAAREKIAQWPGKLLPSQWAENFQQLLQAIAWPGTRALDSVAWQIANRFDEVLLDMARLDDVCGKVDAGEAQKLLQQLCVDVVFQPQANAQAPIQVLGMLEVSGQQFDAIWVMHMADEQLPAAPKPNPFIPIALQKHHRLPRSSIEHEWEYVKRWQHNLRFSCQQLIWSCAEQDGDNRLRVSALISDLPISDSAQLAPLPPPSAPAKLESISDNVAIPFADGEAIKGGVEALRAQARNPLAAFAQFRLNAFAVEAISSFTTPRLHGLLLHACLQAFWSQLRDQKTLLACAENELNDAIEQAINTAFSTVEQHEGKTLPTVWRRLEADLLRRLMHEWLALEKSRAPFVVQATEQALQWQYRHWAVSMRIDRVDINADGEQLIIDYKSGIAPSPQQWYQSPLFEPQLPLYALALGESVSAIAFAQLKRGDMKWSGRASSDSWGSTIKIESDWNGLRAQWQQNITQLADDYLNGDVANRYWSYGDMRQHPLRAFLRIPTTMTADEGAE